MSPTTHFRNLILLLFLTQIAMGQIPQAMNYQAVARDASGTPYSNRTISLRITISTGINPGTPEYQETQKATTNQFGLFTIKVGEGTPILNSLSQIPWATGDKYMLVEFDPEGGINYLNMGSTQMVSVPYALYAATAGGSAGATGPQGLPATLNWLA